MMRLTAAQVAAIEGALHRGERVELIPAKDEIRIMRVHRESIRSKAGEKTNRTPHP